MAAPSKLTERRIEALKYDPEGPSRQVQWDDLLSQFGVRVYPSGRKSFVVAYGEARRRKLFTLGKVGVLTLSQARQKARETLVKVDQGEDPVEEKKAKRREREEAISVKDLAEEFLKHQKARWSERHHKESSRRIQRRIVPAFGSKLAADVSRADVNRLHAEITDGGSPIEANRVGTLLHGMFEWAEDFGYLQEGHRNPARRKKGSKVGRNPEGSRTRFLRREEAPRLLRAADSTGEPLDGVIVRLWLLTGLRRSELLHRRWSDIDLKGATLTVPKTKNGREHTVPLSRRAVELLSTLPRPVWGDAPVFPGSRPDQPMTDFKRGWSRIQRLSDLNDLTIHDLRRTVATWLTHMGKVPLSTVSALLNHKTPGAGITAIYTRPVFESMREGLETMAKLLEEIEPVAQEKSAAS